jgi:hypothetical protein
MRGLPRAVLASALVACCSVPAAAAVRPPRTLAPTVSAVPAGYRVRRLTEAGFAVAFPAGWQLLQRRDAAWPGAAQTLARVDRTLAPYLAALVTPDSPLKLLGFDRSLPAAKVTVLVSHDSFGARWARGALRTVRTLPGVRGLTHRRLRIGAGNALVLRYERAGLVTLQLVVPRGDSLLTLTLTAPPAAAGRYRALFLAVGRTLDVSVPILHP